MRARREVLELGDGVIDNVIDLPRTGETTSYLVCDNCERIIDGALCLPCLAAANAIGNFLGWCYPYPWPCALCGEDLWELDEYGSFEGLWCGCENMNGGGFWMAYLETWNRRPSLVAGMQTGHIE